MPERSPSQGADRKRGLPASGDGRSRGVISAASRRPDRWGSLPASSRRSVSPLGAAASAVAPRQPEAGRTRAGRVPRMPLPAAGPMPPSRCRWATLPSSREAGTGPAAVTHSKTAGIRRRGNGALAMGFGGGGPRSPLTASACIAGLIAERGTMSRRGSCRKVRKENLTALDNAQEWDES